MAVASASSSATSTRTSCWAPQRARRSAVPSSRRHRHADLGDHPADGVGQDGGVEPGRRRLGGPGPAVGPEHHVEVDEAAALELDHLDVGEAGHRAQLAVAHAAGLGHLSVEAVRGPAPEPRHVGVPQHRAPVVEALGAERLADGTGRLRRGGAKHESDRPWGQIPALRRGRHGRGRSPETSARCTGPKEGAVRVTKSWGWSTTLGVDALAAPDAGGHQLPGVGLVEAGARRADGGPPVLAGDDEVALGQLSGRAVQGDAAQPDRVGAQAGLVDLGQDRPPVGGRRSSRPSACCGHAWPARRWRRRRGSGCGS